MAGEIENGFLVTVGEAADILKVSKSMVYKLIEGRSLQALRIGATIRIRMSDIDEYIKLHLTA